MAYGKTRKEIADHIGADEVNSTPSAQFPSLTMFQLIYQSLDDLKAACFEAIEGPTEITDFEVGVFCGKYQTDVPESYFDHIAELRARGKKRKNPEEEISGMKKPTLVGSAGPVNGQKSVTSQEDIT